MKIRLVRRNTDERLRDLERRAKAGDSAAKAEWIAALKRSGLPVPVEKIELDRAEGPSKECYAVTVKTFAEAQKQLKKWGRSAPRPRESGGTGGYDKTDFKVTFADGESYDGRYDLIYGGTDDSGDDLFWHIKNYLLFLANERRPVWTLTREDGERIWARMQADHIQHGWTAEAKRMLDQYGFRGEALPNPGPDERARRAAREGDLRAFDREMARTGRQTYRLDVLEQEVMTEVREALKGDLTPAVLARLARRMALVAATQQQIQEHLSDSPSGRGFVDAVYVEESDYYADLADTLERQVAPDLDVSDSPLYVNFRKAIYTELRRLLESMGLRTGDKRPRPPRRLRRRQQNPRGQDVTGRSAQRAGDLDAARKAAMRAGDLTEWLRLSILFHEKDKTFDRERAKARKRQVAALKKELKPLLRKFQAAGYRGPELASRIDELRGEIMILEQPRSFLQEVGWAAEFGDPIARAAFPAVSQHKGGIQRSDGVHKHFVKPWPLENVEQQAGRYPATEPWQIGESPLGTLMIYPAGPGGVDPLEDPWDLVFEAACNGSPLHLSALLWVRYHNVLWRRPGLEFDDPFWYLQEGEEGTEFEGTQGEALTSYGEFMSSVAWSLDLTKFEEPELAEAYLVEKWFWNGVLDMPAPYTLQEAATARQQPEARTNPDLPQHIPPEQRFLPALRPEPLPRGEWKPPQSTFELAASGRLPLVYMPEGTYEKPGLVTAHARLLTPAGLASPTAWYDLLAAAGHSANVFLIDRYGERWRLIDVLLDYGHETGQLQLRHVGARSRGGDRYVDVSAAYGHAIPIVVYKRGGPLT